MNHQISTTTMHVLMRLVQHHLSLQESSSCEVMHQELRPKELENALEELRLCSQSHPAQRLPLPLKFARRVSEPSW